MVKVSKRNLVSLKSDKQKHSYFSQSNQTSLTDRVHLTDCVKAIYNGMNIYTFTSVEVCRQCLKTCLRQNYQSNLPSTNNPTCHHYYTYTEVAFWLLRGWDRSLEAKPQNWISLKETHVWTPRQLGTRQYFTFKVKNNQTAGLKKIYIYILAKFTSLVNVSKLQKLESTPVATWQK